MAARLLARLGVLALALTAVSSSRLGSSAAAAAPASATVSSSSYSPSPLNAAVAALGNASGIVIDGKALPEWFGTAASASLIVVGAGEVFVGYRLFRITLFLLGSAAGGIPTFLVAWDQIDDANAIWIGLGLGVLAGLLCGAASFFFYKVGVFLCGASLGVVVALVLNMAVLYKLGAGNTPFIVAAIALGLAFGTLGYYFMRFSMVAATSVVGAYAFIRSVGFFAGNYPPNEFDIEQQLQNGQTALPWQIYAYFAGWLVLVLLGVAVQLNITARKSSSAEKDQWEKAYDESGDVGDLLRGRRSKKGRKSSGGKKKKSRKGKGGKARAEPLLEEGDGSGGGGATEWNEGGGEVYDDGAYEEGGEGEDYSEYVEPAIVTPSKGKGAATGISLGAYKPKQSPASIQW